jgi:hypothetical protein
VDACLPLLARTALLERLARWEELGEGERERLREELAVVTAIAGEG